MSFASALVQLSMPMLSLAELVRGAGMLFLLAGLLMFFRPLLTGIVRALALAARVRLMRRATARRAIDAIPGQRA